MATLERHPSLSREEARAKVADQFAISGYKEYSATPWAVTTQASFPVELWDPVFYSWLSYKGHAQSYHDLESIVVLATRTGDEVLAIFTMVFSTMDALDAYLEGGYTVGKMLVELNVAEEDINLQIFREFS